MKLVLLSGGSGTRLWPMSNESRSKQFLKVLPSAMKQGQLVSMLQRTWELIETANLTHCTYICSSRAQSDIIEAQIGRVRLIEEPERRDTFPAVSLATLYLFDVEGAREKEVVVVVPIDHDVDNSYFHQIARLEAVLSSSGADIALMGVTPTRPTSKFGYIKVIETESSATSTAEYLKVESFIEKPELPQARQLIHEGALWNCGVFAFRIGYLKSLLNEMGFPTRYDDLVSTYTQLPHRSFDYEVVEKASNVVVLPYRGRWKDLGTWETLCEEMEPQFVGKGHAYQCEQTHVINELGIPVVAMGLRNTVVVATPDGILVSHKEKTPMLKDAIGPYTGRPMYEERLWGSYRVLDYQKLADGTEVLTKCVMLHPGRNISYQRHHKRSEVWTVIEGKGQFVINDMIQDLYPGDVVQIPPQVWHAVRAIEDLMFIEVQRGSELVEEDIERRFMKWEEIETHLKQKHQDKG